MANVNAATAVLGRQLAAGLLRREARRHDDANAAEAEATSRQTASVVTFARDVALHVPARRETQEPDVHLADIQVERHGL